jgi:hypothetical protein
VEHEERAVGHLEAGVDLGAVGEGLTFGCPFQAGNRGRVAAQNASCRIEGVDGHVAKHDMPHDLAKAAEARSHMEVREERLRRAQGPRPDEVAQLPQARLKASVLAYREEAAGA